MLGMEYFVSRGLSKTLLTDLSESLSLFWLLGKKKCLNWVAYEQQKFIAHRSGG